MLLFTLTAMPAPKDDAEDVTQQTYLRVLHAAPRYRPQGKPMAWLLTIAKRLSLSTVLSSYQRSIQKLRTLWKETD